MNIKIKKFWVSFLAILVMATCAFPSQFVEAAGSENDATTTIIACSDFQNPSGNDAGKQTVSGILAAMANDGIVKADGFFCCGDYDYGMYNTQAGITALTEAVRSVVTQNMVFVQGNHDTSDSISRSGNNDSVNGAYGVFVINEDDYMWRNDNESRIQQTAQSLTGYINEKLRNQYDKPIFVLSHLPLHYSMRTRNDGDGKYAKYIFDVLNEAGKKGLNVFFLFGHDHSNGWDDYLGGSAVYLTKGDKIQIAQNSRTDFKEETLQFTYMNAGYIGYYNNHNGADDALTMSVIRISANDVVINRYAQDGKHDLKSVGVSNNYKGEGNYYTPTTNTYASPQTVTLSTVTDTSEIGTATSGKIYTKITDLSQLKDNDTYLLICNNGSSSYYMIPEVVTKANASGVERVGFKLENTSPPGDTIVSSLNENKEWTLTKNGNGWLLGENEKYVKLTDTADQGVKATLEDSGDVFTINGSGNSFEFKTGNYVLNYNSRGLINGYTDQPASFSIYVHNCVFDQEVVSDTTLKQKADCEHPAVYYKSCTCGKKSTNDDDTFTVGNPLGHSFSSWIKDEEKHWKVCDSCGKTDSEGKHDFGSDSICDTCGFNVLEEPDVEKEYAKITDIAELKDGQQYLIVYHSSSDYIMLPEVVTRTSGSGERTGFELEATTSFGADTVQGYYGAKEWTLIKKDTGWLLEHDGQYVKLTDLRSDGKGITATFEDSGDTFVVGGNNDAFTFTSTSGNYVLNYNGSRKLINGFGQDPATFRIYGVKVSKAQLDKVIEEASKLDASGYTAESYAKVTEELNKAKVLKADENATQEAVDAQVKALQDAIKALKKKEELKPSDNNNPDDNKKPEIIEGAAGNRNSNNSGEGVTSRNEKDIPATGDETQMIPYLLLLIGASVAVGLILKRKTRT